MGSKTSSAILAVVGIAMAAITWFAWNYLLI